jgi:puromycin-sensitive aminopeptidase
MTKAKKVKTKVRLEKHIKPNKYTLTLKPDLESFTFEGKEIIDIVLDKSVKEITLHSKDINIKTVEIFEGKKSDFAKAISYDTGKETATFKFASSIKKGKAKLVIVFEGVINDHLRGFYRSRYTLNGKTKHIATTQFEATDARRAFPCFDEPAQKAIFDVSLIIPGNHTAISNTLPSKISEHEAGYKIVEFASTPRMSTYLLAFIIGEFEYIEGYTKDKVQVRVFTTEGKKHQARFALDVAIRSLEFYNEYFGIAYPLPVLDLIAIPDFESAAMENWGAVTFRETALLVDEEHTSFANKQWVAIVIAHELAHQWFGNLVTMEWWTDLWLNEGFASYMEYLTVDHIFPEWKVWDLYLTERYSIAMRLDALAGSHPIEVPVHHPNEINEIFDAVSYAKGSAVIRMLAEYLGKDVFKKGLQLYMKKHSHGNTNTVDLWNAFEKASKKPVKKIMSAWTSKTGYPLLSTSFNKKGFSISQERFFSSRVSKETNKEKTMWQVPIKYESNNEVQKELLTQKSSKLLGTSIGKVNKGETTLARVKYDTQTLARLSAEVEQGKLSTYDRLGLIRDMFALAESGHIKTTEALEFCLKYKNETEYIVWAEIASGIDKINHLIQDEPFVDLYHKYAREIFTPLAKKMTWENKKGEDNSNTFLRNLALSHSAFYGDKDTVKEGQNRFKTGNIKADLRSVVYSIVARMGNKSDWLKFEKMYQDAKLDEERDRIGRALSLFKDKTLLARTLTYALSSNVRTQDAPFIIGQVWQNSFGRDLTWQFVKHNWEKIMKTYGEGGHFLGRILAPLGSHKKISDAKEIEKFFKKNNAPGATRTIEQSLERIYSNAAWLKSDKKDIEKWLKKNYTK